MTGLGKAQERPIEKGLIRHAQTAGQQEHSNVLRSFGLHIQASTFDDIEGHTTATLGVLFAFILADAHSSMASGSFTRNALTPTHFAGRKYFGRRGARCIMYLET